VALVWIVPNVVIVSNEDEMGARVVVDNNDDEGGGLARCLVPLAPE
jgi:hypothetical protein